MAKAHIHAASSAKKFGGVMEDYLPIHELLDSSKQVISSNLHRFLTHHSWFIANILPKIFGRTIVNSAGKEVHVADIGEQHVLEDFGMKFIPTPQDYSVNMEFQSWMNNGMGYPDSCKNLRKKPTFQIVDAEDEEKVELLVTKLPYSD